MRANTTEGEADSVDLSSLLNALWHGRFVLFFAALISLLAGGYYAFSVAEESYRSTAVVMLNSREEQVVDLEGVIGGLGMDDTVINTEVEVLRSRSLLAKVVDEMDLVSDPEFNALIRPPTLVQQAKSIVQQYLGMEADEDFVASRHREATIDGVLNHVTIRALPQSLVFQVAAQSNDPRKAARLADTLVDIYITNQLEVKFDATRHATSWLTDRVAGLQVELEAAEARVNEFTAESTLINSEVLLAMETRLKSTRDRISDMKADLARSTTLIDGLQGAQSPTEQAALAEDFQLNRLLDLVEAENGSREAFEARVSQIIETEQSNIGRMRTQIETLQKSVADSEARIEAQNAEQIQLQQLIREAEASRLLYEYFLGRLKETSAQAGIQQADSRKLSDAVVPVNPFAPRKSLILATSLIFGVLAGAIFVLVRDANRNGFVVKEDVERLTGYAVMGELPLIPERKRKKVIDYLREKPLSAAVEAVRNLRTSLMLRDSQSVPQILMVTSALPGEGKTLVAISLAMNLKQMGERVLLVEGDIRRRVFSEYIESHDRPGMMAVLEGDKTLSDVIYHEEAFGCDVLLAGQSEMNSTDVFASTGFSKLIAELRDMYDFVLFDTAPVALVPDGRLVAQQADARLFVVKWDSTPRIQVIRALQELDSAGRPATGVVLNQINLKRADRYGYGSYYGAYEQYSGTYFKN